MDNGNLPITNKLSSKVIFLILIMTIVALLGAFSVIWLTYQTPRTPFEQPLFIAALIAVLIILIAIAVFLRSLRTLHAFSSHLPTNTPSSSFLIDQPAEKSTGALSVSLAETQSSLDQANNQIVRLRRDLDNFRRLTKELNSTLDLEAILRMVISEAVTATKADFGNICIFDLETDHLMFNVTEGWPPEINVSIDSQIPNSRDGIIGRVLRIKQTEVIDDVSQDPDYILYPQLSVSEMVVPIDLEDIIKGVINLESQTFAAFSPVHQQYIETLALQASIAIRNAEEFSVKVAERHRVSHRLNQLERLAEIKRAFRANMTLEEILEDIAFAIQEAVGFNLVVVSVNAKEQLHAVAGAGVPIANLTELKEKPLLVTALEPLLKPEHRLANSYFVPASQSEPYLNKPLVFLGEEISSASEDPMAWQSKDVLFTPLRSAEASLLGVIAVASPINKQRPNENIVEALELFAVQASTAIENANLFLEVQHRITQLRLFSQISSHISAILDPTEILNEVVNLIANAFSYYYVQIYQIDTYDPTSLVSKNGAGAALTGDYVVIPETRLSINEQSVVGLVASQQRFILVNDVRLDSRFSPHPNLPETLSQIAFPLRASSTVFGVLDIQHNEVNGFDEDDSYNLQALADQLAVATQNARLFDQTVQRERLSSALGKAGLVLNEILDTDQTSDVICQEAVIAFRVHSTLLWLLEGDKLHGAAAFGRNVSQFSGMVTDSASQNALEARIVKLRRTEFLNEADFHPHNISPELIETLNIRSILGAPLLSGDRVLGAIMLIDCENPNRFNSQDETSAMLFANQAAIALTNARLFEQEQQRVQELDLLNQTGQAINTATKFGDLFQVVCEQVSKLMDAKNMVIALYDKETQSTRFPLVKGEAESSLQPLRDDNALIEHIIANRQPLLLTHNVRQHLEEMGFHPTEPVPQSWLGVPMLFGDEIFGVIAAQSYHHESAYTTNDLNLLSTIAGQATIALQNMQLVAELEHRVEDRTRALEETFGQLKSERDRVDLLFNFARQLASSLDLNRVLNESLQMLARTIGVTKGAILLVSPATDNLIYRAALGRAEPLPREGKETNFKIGMGLAGYVLETREPMIIANVTDDDIWLPDEVEQDNLSVIAVPLISGFDALGALLLFHSEMDYFTQDHLSLLTAAAPLIATSISNADLFTLITDQAERVGTLFSRVRVEAGKNEAIIAGIADGVLVVDLEQTIQLINPAAIKILGIFYSNPKEQPLDKIFSTIESSSEIEVARQLYEIILSQQQRGTDQEPVTARINIDDKVIVVSLSTISFGSDHNAPPNTLVVLRDISREAELDRIKDEFISTVSHELRTPMTSIKGYLDLLVGEKVGSLTDMQHKFLKTIQNNADRLTTLVNDILEISGLDAGKIKLDFQPIDMAQLTHSVVNSFDYQIANKTLNVTINTPEYLPPAYADESRVSQVLINLVSNAIKYSRPSDSITIRIRPVKHLLEVTVQDTGLGISKEDQKQIFERFFRAERDADSLVDGTGLGLSIAKMFVELMGGEIWVESELGLGSRFGFTLPIDQTHNRSLDDLLKLGKRRILVVDDQDEIRTLLKSQLEDAGFEVRTVAKSNEVLAQAKAYQPSLITLDLMLDGKSGFEILELLKSEPETKDIPVIIASVMPNQRTKSLALGAADYIVKPFEQTKVLNTVHRLVLNVEEQNNGAKINKVLVVDDDKDIVNWLQTALTDREFEVAGTTTGQQALELVNQTKPDLILLDLKLPDMDGFLVIKKLRENEETANIPIIVITGTSLDQSHDTIKVLGLGASHLITKPFSFDDLVSEIKRLEAP